MKIINKVLESSPWVEVAIKTFYWRSFGVNAFLGKIRRLFKSNGHAPIVKNVKIERIFDALRELNAASTGLMIVHSSAISLSHTGLSPKSICEKLLEFLGPNGTLAMPAIPIFRGEPSGPDRLISDLSCQKFIYNVQKTPPWTGALPKALMRMPGSVRSRHPLNTMVAIGPQAEAMMAKNIVGDNLKPCGPNSSWKYCLDNEAIIVCLGVDSAHSLTMIHVAEDCWSDQWPIPGWYRERIFHIIDNEFECDLKTLERHPRWAINYAERTLQRDLLRLGIIQVREVDGVRIEVCSSTRLINYLASRRAKAYPYWVPFWERVRL